MDHNDFEQRGGGEYSGGTYYSTPRWDDFTITDEKRARGRFSRFFLAVFVYMFFNDDDFKTAISRGISKVNIFTDMNQAGAKAAVGAYTEGKGMTDMILPSIEAVKQSVMTKMRLFHSENRG